MEAALILFNEDEFLVELWLSGTRLPVAKVFIFSHFCRICYDGPTLFIFSQFD